MPKARAAPLPQWAQLPIVDDLTMKELVDHVGRAEIDAQLLQSQVNAVRADAEEAERAGDHERAHALMDKALALQIDCGEYVRFSTECFDRMSQLKRQAAGQRARAQAVRDGFTSPGDQQMTRTESGTDNFDPVSYNVNKGIDPWSRDNAPLRSLSTSSILDRAKAALDKSPKVEPEGKERIESLLGAGDFSERDITAKWAIATSDPNYATAFVKLLKDPQHGHLDFTPEETAAHQRVRSVKVDRAMSLTDGAGGYLVPFDLDPTVLVTTGFASNPIRQIARVVQTSSDTWNGITAGATPWSFDAEASEVSDDSSTFTQPTVTVRTARAFIPISIELWMDAVDLLDQLRNMLIVGRDDLEANVFINGLAASNQPVGLVSRLTGTASEITGTGESLAIGATPATNAITDVYNLLNGLAPRWRGNAKWVADQTTIQQINRLVPSGSTTDVPLLVGNTILQKEYFEASYVDDIQLATAVATTRPLLCGDFSTYCIADRIGMTVETIGQLVAVNPGSGRPTYQRGLAAFYRTGADLTVTPAAGGPIRMLKVVSA